MLQSLLNYTDAIYMIMVLIDIGNANVKNTRIMCTYASLNHEWLVACKHTGSYTVGDNFCTSTRVRTATYIILGLIFPTVSAH